VFAVGKFLFSMQRYPTKLEGFHDEVNTLCEPDVGGEVVPAQPLLHLAFKLRRTSRGLQRWSQRRVGSVRDMILVANDVILRLYTA
jgi:hypothetical protein